MTSHDKRACSGFLMIMIICFVMSYSTFVHAAATKLVWDKSDFRCGDICGEFEQRGYKIYTKIDGEDYVVKKQITDPNVTECNLSELSLTPGKFNYIVIQAYKKIGDYVSASEYSEVIPWEDGLPGKPTNLSITPETEIPITVNWDAATDNAGGSGIAGYYLKLDTNPGSIPSTDDRKIDAETTTVTITLDWPELTSGGQYYLHIRSVDAALNLSDTAHYGPFTINSGTAVAVSYSKPDRPSYVDGGAFTEKDGTIIVTAAFTNSLSGPPQIAIDYALDIDSADNDADLPPTPMTATGDSKVWTFPMTIPSGPGNSGPAKITITGTDTAGNPVIGHTGNKFTVDNIPPHKVNNVRTIPK